MCGRRCVLAINLLGLFLCVFAGPNMPPRSLAASSLGLNTLLSTLILTLGPRGDLCFKCLSEGKTGGPSWIYTNLPPLPSLRNCIDSRESLVLVIKFSKPSFLEPSDDDRMIDYKSSYSSWFSFSRTRFIHFLIFLVSLLISGFHSETFFSFCEILSTVSFRLATFNS